MLFRTFVQKSVFVSGALFVVSSIAAAQAHVTIGDAIDVNGGNVRIGNGIAVNGGSVRVGEGASATTRKSSSSKIVTRTTNTRSAARSQHGTKITAREKRSHTQVATKGNRGHTSRMIHGAESASARGSYTRHESRTGNSASRVTEVETTKAARRSVVRESGTSTGGIHVDQDSVTVGDNISVTDGAVRVGGITVE